MKFRKTIADRLKKELLQQVFMSSFFCSDGRYKTARSSEKVKICLKLINRMVHGTTSRSYL